MDPIEEMRTAIGRHTTKTSDKPWDGPFNEARLKSGESKAYYSRAFAFSETGKDPKAKSSYRFIHHEVSADGTPGAASIRAAISGIAVLNGARGGTTIPPSDRQGVWNHLAKHLRDAGREPPELRSNPDEPEERASHPDCPVTVSKRGEVTHIEGHAAIFNELSLPIMGFRERIKPGAFTKTIQESDIRALFNHDPLFVLGRQSAGTLEVKEDERGLFYSAKIPNTQWARDLAESIDRKDITQGSFRFRAIKDTFGHENGQLVREVHEARLLELGPNTFPAYPGTDATVRSLAAYAGIDQRALDSAIHKFMKGVSLNEDERTIIKCSAEFLRSCSREPAEGGHSAEPVEGDHSKREDPGYKPQSLGLLRQKLNLLYEGQI